MPDKTKLPQICSITKKPCTTATATTDCPPIPTQTCNNGICSVTGISYNGYCSSVNPCPTGNQTCDLGGEKFPEDPLFFKPYSNTATSTRVVDLGAQRVVPIESLNVNTGNSGYFGALLQDTPLTGPKKWVTVTGSPLPANPYKIDSFLPYYGVSSNKLCGGVREIKDTNLYLGNSKGDGKVVTKENLSGDICRPWHAETGDYNYDTPPCHNDSDTCQYENWKEIFAQQENTVTSGRCISLFKDCTSDDDCTPEQECKIGHCQLINPNINCFFNQDCPQSSECVWRFPQIDEAACSTAQQSNNKWVGVNKDSGNNLENDDTGCAYECLNMAKKYNITKGPNTGNAIEALKRIFINKPLEDPWRVFNLVGNTYQLFNNPFPLALEPTACNGNGRGPRPYITSQTLSTGIDKDKDYCYIYPQINNFTIDGVGPNSNQDVEINGSRYITATFETAIDVEQLPIKKLAIKWGYKDDLDADVITDLGSNLKDGFRSVTKQIRYSDIDNYNNVALCTGNPKVCYIKPSIIIKDNWGYSTSTSPFVFAKQIIVSPGIND